MTDATYNAYHRMKSHMRGRFGESLCAHILLCNGYEILERNYKVIGAEVDIICRKGSDLVFVEVKTWAHYTEDDISCAVNVRKLSHIVACAHAYMATYEHIERTQTSVRVDVMFVQISHHTIIHYKGVL